MVKSKFGERFTCSKCETPFYDMNRKEALCPKCGFDQRKTPKKSAVKAPKKPVVAEEYETEDEEPTVDESLGEFPANTGGEETFDPNKNRLAVDDVPDQEI